MPKNRYLVISLALCVLDQWTKWLVETGLPLHEPLAILPGLNLTHVRNTGVAFGMFAAHGRSFGPLLLTILGIVALTVVVYFFARTPCDDRRMLFALALILGGATGNLIDRVASGAVTDFIDVYVRGYHWHTFNVADSGITIGVAIMLLDIVLPGKQPGTRQVAPGSVSPGGE